jgi:hypothetical protein
MRPRTTKPTCSGSKPTATPVRSSRRDRRRTTGQCKARSRKTGCRRRRTPTQKDFNSDQERDENGRFGSGSGASKESDKARTASNAAGSSNKAADHQAASQAHYNAAVAHSDAHNAATAAGAPAAAKEHENAYHEHTKLQQEHEASRLRASQEEHASTERPTPTNGDEKKTLAKYDRGADKAARASAEAHATSLKGDKVDSMRAHTRATDAHSDLAQHTRLLAAGEKNPQLQAYMRERAKEHTNIARWHYDESRKSLEKALAGGLDKALVADVIKSLDAIAKNLAKDGDGGGDSAADGSPGANGNYGGGSDPAAQNQEGTPHRVHFQGMPVVIDRPKGFTQTGEDAEGTPWSRVYKNDYGYIEGTQGGDGEGLDVYLGANPNADAAHWVIQKKADGSFDEYKAMLGFNNQDDAKQAYLAHTPKRYYAGMATMPISMMKCLLGMAPAHVMKSMSAMVASLKAQLAEPSPCKKFARAWVAMRGLDDETTMGAAGACMAKAVVKAADAIDLGDAADMSTQLAKAQLSWLCNAWDTAAATITNGADLSKSMAVLGQTTEMFSRITVAVFAAAAANLPQRVLTFEDRWQIDATLGPGVPPPAPPHLGALGAPTPERPHMGALAMPVDLAKRLEKPQHGFKARIVEVKKAAPAPAAPGGAPPVELRYVSGIVLEPDTVDGQGDTYSAEEIRKSEWLWMERFQNIGLQHKALVNGSVNVVESYIAPVDMNVNGSQIKAGTWMLGVHVVDDALWAAIKNGQLTGFSIAGFAQREELS